MCCALHEKSFQLLQYVTASFRQDVFCHLFTSSLVNNFRLFPRNEIGRGDMLTFEHFDELLQKFGDSSEENAEIAEAINRAANNSCE